MHWRFDNLYSVIGHENPITRAFLFGQTKLANELFRLCECKIPALRLARRRRTDVWEKGLDVDGHKDDNRLQSEGEW